MFRTDCDRWLTSVKQASATIMALFQIRLNIFSQSCVWGMRVICKWPSNISFFVSESINSVLAGNPAKVVKTGISWNSLRPMRYQEKFEPPSRGS